MDFRQLLEAACGQSNPIEQLSGHVTYDQAQQERISHPGFSGRTQNNSMPPQSFRMEDLMHEMRAIESDMNLVPPTLSRTNMSGATWLNGSGAQMAQGNLYDAHEPLPNEFHANRQNNYDFGYHYERPRTFYRFPVPQQQFQSQSVQMMTPEELELLQREIEESQKEFWETPVENMEEIESASQEETEEEIVDSSQEESKDLQSTSKPLKLCWDGLGLIDETRVLDPSLNSPLLFMQFEQIYVEKIMNKKIPNKNQNARTPLPTRLMDVKPYSFIENNTMLGQSTALEEGKNAYAAGNLEQAILCFEAAVQQDPNSLYNLSKLGRALIKNNELQKGLCIANQMLKLAPKHIWIHSFISDIYVRRRCSYQVCQYTFNWLRFNKSYADIALPNFKMEDKTTLDLDEDTLNAVKKMFIKAAQRNPSDTDVQMFLAKLCFVSGEMGKVSDCLQVISNVNVNHKSPNAIDSKLNLGLSYFYDNKPEEALRILLEVAENKTKKFEIYRKIGFVYMYLKKYTEAAYYLTEGLKEKYTNIRDMQSGGDFARLSLCLKLLHRSNFRGNTAELFHKTCKKFMKSYCDTHFS